MQLEHATEADFPAIINLVNAAYRGKGAVESWNIESGIIEGTRLTDSLLREDLAGKPHAHFLITRDPNSGAVIGTVWLEPVDDQAWYLGLFTVDPAIQNQQLGRTLLTAAEEFAKARGARSIRMGVLSVRDTLIAWYERRGYSRTGGTEPFPYDDDRFGKPLRENLVFAILEKHL
ncbi:MAG TPA: GNAT family N-acetyltransferase [Terracidiphilus sp.]|nr:GNAT family N-acetyltransferase [Terracidiphilus sp.]